MTEAFIAKIRAQQKGKEKSPVYCVGEQLLELCEANPEFEKIISEDIDKLTLADCEKKIHNSAKENGGFCGPKEAEEIIRKFYGLPDASSKPAKASGSPVLNFADFLK